MSPSPPPNAALQDLAALVGDEAAREIVRLFLQTFPESIVSLCCSGRQDQMRIAHGLKSSALHMGADRLSDRIGEVEDKLAAPGVILGTDDLAATNAEFESFAVDLRRYVAT